MIDSSRGVWGRNNNCQAAVITQLTEIGSFRSKRPLIERAQMHRIPRRVSAEMRKWEEQTSAEGQENREEAKTAFQFPQREYHRRDDPE
jgi:hypothetical protein